MQCYYKKRERNWLPIWSGWWSYHVGDYKRGKREYCNAVSMHICTDGKEQCPKTFLRIGSYYKTTIDNLKIMNHLKLLTKYI